MNGDEPDLSQLRDDQVEKFSHYLSVMRELAALQAEEEDAEVPQLEYELEPGYLCQYTILCMLEKSSDVCQTFVVRDNFSCDVSLVNNVRHLYSAMQKNTFGNFSLFRFLVG